MEILNFFNVEHSPPDLKFDFESHSEEMEEAMRERLKERSKIGINQELRLNFSAYKTPEDKTSYYVQTCFPHKRDFGQTFGIGLAKMTKSIHYWLLFFNQGLYTRSDWAPPQLFDYRPRFEVVTVIDRKFGTVQFWVRGTEMVHLFRDPKLISGDVVPCFVCRKEKSHCRLKIEGEEEGSEKE